MDTDEDKLPASAKSVLSILRLEFAAGRISQEEADFLRDAVRIKTTLGVIGGFVIKFATFLGAICHQSWFNPGGLSLATEPRRLRMRASLRNSRLSL